MLHAHVVPKTENLGVVGAAPSIVQAVGVGGQGTSDKADDCTQIQLVQKLTGVSGLRIDQPEHFGSSDTQLGSNRRQPHLWLRR